MKRSDMSAREIEALTFIHIPLAGSPSAKRMPGTQRLLGLMTPPVAASVTVALVVVAALLRLLLRS